MRSSSARGIPLATLSRYFTDPVSYDPARAMEDSLNEFPENERDAVRALVSVYGSSFLGEKDYPPGKSKNAQTYQELEKKLTAQPRLKDLWEDVKPTLQDDLAKSNP